MENLEVNDDKFTNFIEEVTTNKLVYALKNGDEYAFTYSEEFAREKDLLEEEEEENNLDDEAVEVLCFWSDKSLAENCRIDEWESYTVEEIPLSTFLEEWCVGMFNDQMLAGLNYDADMDGYESEILYLMNEIVKILEENSIKLNFNRFNNLADLREHIDEVLKIK